MGKDDERLWQEAGLFTAVDNLWKQGTKQSTTVSKENAPIVRPLGENPLSFGASYPSTFFTTPSHLTEIWVGSTEASH
jgi:hypothetical protein